MHTEDLVQDAIEKLHIVQNEITLLRTEVWVYKEALQATGLTQDKIAACVAAARLQVRPFTPASEDPLSKRRHSH